MEINGALQAPYEEDTKAFTEDIKKLFRNNAKFNNDFPQANIEAYMILLFEIARRLVALKEPRELQVQYDELPIGISKKQGWKKTAKIVLFVEKNCKC